MTGIHKEYRKLPGVDKILSLPSSQKLTARYGLERVTRVVREVIEQARTEIGSGRRAWLAEEIVEEMRELLSKEEESSLKPVINGSGIILHTNLGRAPLGAKVMADLAERLQGYSNLEYDLNEGRRGQRNDHIKNLLSQITGAEAAVAVNNTAAALLLTLKTLAAGKEVIISRGELIEIGGSFRLPDIMAESGAKMVEVGCTNRTRLLDYSQAINENTGMILKAHKSNYYIGGFQEEVEVSELSELAHANGLIMFYDIGSGLLRKPENLDLGKEPDVRSALAAGVDVISFSGDKLLGGPQAGIIAGKQKYIELIGKAPLMRALRVGKLTISALISAMQAYLNPSELVKYLPVFGLLDRSFIEKEKLAKELSIKLKAEGIGCEVVESIGRTGGGTLPALEIRSCAVKLLLANSEAAEKLFRDLLRGERAVVGILREGELLFDVTSLFAEDIEVIVEQVGRYIE